jgi:dethiobiotin synthetase
MLMRWLFVRKRDPDFPEIPVLLFSANPKIQMNNLNSPLFITGIGTGVGKTVIAAIITEALQADYWKPVQSGNEEGTDSEWVKSMISNKASVIHPECYSLKAPVSPHLAARKENIAITVQRICEQVPVYSRNLIVEGAGGLLVPLNEKEFIKDLIIAIKARVILVSRNYLGSINHSLLTAAQCKQHDIPVAGWVFNGYEPSYENEISTWSGYPRIASVPEAGILNKSFVKAMAESHRESIISMVC